MGENRVYYHATSETNFRKIMQSGSLHTGIDGIVYLTESAEDAYAFIGIRVWDEDIYILCIEGLDESKVVETFDHSYEFFKCRSYGYPEDISTKNINISGSSKVLKRI